MTSEQQLIDKAFELKEKGKFNESVLIFKEVNKRFEESAVVLQMISMLLILRLNNSEEALPYALRAVELKPTSELSSISLFHCLYNINRRKDAEKEISGYLRAGGKIGEQYKTLFEENKINETDFI